MFIVLSVVVTLPEENQGNVRTQLYLQHSHMEKLEYRDLNNHAITKNGAGSGKKQSVGSKRLSYCYSSPNRRGLWGGGTQ